MCHDEQFDLRVVGREELASVIGNEGFADFLAYCFSNAVLDEDRNMNKKPVKKTHNAKIDSTITNLMTFYLFNNYTQ